MKLKLESPCIPLCCAVCTPARKVRRHGHARYALANGNFNLKIDSSTKVLTGPYWNCSTHYTTTLLRILRLSPPPPLSLFPPLPHSKYYAITSVVGRVLANRDGGWKCKCNRWSSGVAGIPPFFSEGGLGAIWNGEEHRVDWKGGAGITQFSERIRH